MYNIVFLLLILSACSYLLPISYGNQTTYFLINQKYLKLSLILLCTYQIAKVEVRC